MADNEDKKINAAAAVPPVTGPGTVSPELAAADVAGKGAIPPAASPTLPTAIDVKPTAEKVKPPFAAASKAESAKPVLPVAPTAKAPKPKIKTAPAKAKPVTPVVPDPAPVAGPIKMAAHAAPEAAKAAVVPPVAATTAAVEAASPAPGKPGFAGLFPLFMLEEETMDMSANFTGFQTAVTEAQAKAKAAFEKSTSVLGEVSDFAKGNVEAAVESGKIFAEGVQGLGSEFVTESRSAFEKMSGDIKELAAAKSPTDFFKLQGDLVRKNFDTAMAYTSKNSEAMLKLMSDTMAPLSGRMSLAVEKARSAAPTTF